MCHYQKQGNISWGNDGIRAGIGRQPGRNRDEDGNFLHQQASVVRKSQRWSVIRIRAESATTVAEIHGRKTFELQGLAHYWEKVTIAGKSS